MASYDPAPVSVPGLKLHSEHIRRMSSPSPAIWDDRQPLALTSTGIVADRDDLWLKRATWTFVALGVALRIARYLMDYPLWWDEAFVAVNLIRRDYVDLLRPLDYGQVCPILFLWCELALVKLIGFSEWSLRLFPMLCAVASVALFRYVIGRIVRGIPLLLAMAIFATSFHPILHAADVKPYASDLLAALILLAIAIEWWRSPEQARWVWAMAVIAPIALALSNPAIFVAAGCAFAFAPAIANARQRSVLTAYVAFTLSTVVTFFALHLVSTRAQATANLNAMQIQWVAAFPPLSNPLALIRWLATVHTGSTFAYPCGGERGASGLTFLLFTVGAGVLWYRRRQLIVLICLAPFGMALVAAAMRRYPYGGPVPHGSPARVMQYLAPDICLLAGVGAAALITLFRDPRRQRRAICAVLVSLAAVGVVPLTADVFHRYRAVHAQQAREFARQFWPEFMRDVDLKCLRWDLGIGEWDSTNLNVAVYLCNQMIYSPQRQQPRERTAQASSANRVIRYVAPLMDPADCRLAAWLDAMKKRYQLQDCRTLVVNMAEPGSKPRIENYSLYDFVTPDVRHLVHRHRDRTGVERSVSHALE
jgi:hypothetical protein